MGWRKDPEQANAVKAPPGVLFCVNRLQSKMQADARLQQTERRWELLTELVTSEVKK